jgi:hypothetical protein
MSMLPIALLCSARRTEIHAGRSRSGGQDSARTNRRWNLMIDDGQWRRGLAAKGLGISGL